MFPPTSTLPRQGHPSSNDQTASIDTSEDSSVEDALENESGGVETVSNVTSEDPAQPIIFIGMSFST